jgi:ribosomal protein S18 acetylase RimI-like enzyme
MAGMSADLTFRAATMDDLPAIVGLLADDALGSTRELVGEPIDERYVEAFRSITADPRQLLAVADREGRISGCLQLTFIPGLSRLGSWRGQVESVRIADEEQGRGVGRAMLEWAIEVCRERRCRLLQLTTDKSRPEALRFYESLGFVASHEGMKLSLDS